MAGDFKIVASLDIPKSASKINADIPVLEKKLNSIRVLAELDTTRSINSIQSQLNTIAKQAKAPTIKVGIDTSGIQNTQNIANGLKEVETQAQKTARAVNDVKSELLKLDTTDKELMQFKVEFDKDGLIDIEKTLDNAREKFSNFGDVELRFSIDDSGEINKITATITEKTNNAIKTVEKLNFCLNETNTLFEYKSGSGSSGKIKQQIVDVSKDIETYQLKLQNLSEEWTKQGIFVDEIKNKTNSLLSEISQIDNIDAFNNWVSDFDNLNTQAKQLKQNLDEQVVIQKEILRLQTDIAKIDNGKNTAQLTEKKVQLESKQQELNLLQEQSVEITKLMSKEQQNQYIVSNTVKEQNNLNTAIAKAIDSQSKLNSSEQVSYDTSVRKAEVLKSQIQAYKAANPKADKMFGANLDDLIYQLTETPEKVNEIRAKFQALQNEIKLTGKAGKTLGQSITDAAKKFSSWMSLTGIISGLWRDLQKMVTNVIELDSAMTNLKKVTDETETVYSRFLKNTSQQAKELHATMTDLVEQTATWAKLGFSLQEAESLAKISMIYSKVGEVDNTTSVSDLVTAMKAFNIESSKSITIVDALNELGNNFATDTASLGEGLTKSASALSAANNSFEQSVALLTGGTEITQNANEMGSALKVISMRIRGRNICLRIRKVYTPCYA